MHHPTDRIAHTTAFVTPVVEHWLEREIVFIYIHFKGQAPAPPPPPPLDPPLLYTNILIQYQLHLHAATLNSLEQLLSSGS